MNTKESGIQLLLCDADDGKPTLSEPLPEDMVSGVAQSKRPEAMGFPELGADPNDLGEQRWGVIIPEGKRGDRLLEIIAPLYKLRKEQQGKEPPVYRAPAKLSQSDAARWRKQVFDTGSDDEVDKPLYQLILGNLDEVGLAIQQIQGADSTVGRLAFEKDEDYEAYVAKALRWEKAGSAIEQPRALYYTVHDGTGATYSGYQALMKPSIVAARKRLEQGEFPAREIAELGDKDFPSRDEFFRVTATKEPAVLFSVSHGAGAPRAGWTNFEDQKRRQGSMSFGADGVISASDLASRPFLPGGIWFMLACFGAGTPDSSAYRHWLERLSKVGQFSGPVAQVLKALPRDSDPPFIAQGAQAVLKNPDGPLAFMGHIDLAWTYSFSDLDSADGPTNRPGKFMGLVRSLCKGDRAGVAFRYLMRFFSRTNDELSSLYDEAAAAQDPALTAQQEARRAHLWMLRQDLAGYILLGDPAARLPLGKPEASAAPEQVQTQAGPPPPTVPQVATVTIPAPVEKAASSEPTLDIEKTERAIAEAILDGSQISQIAGRHDIPADKLTHYVELYQKAGRDALRRG